MLFMMLNITDSACVCVPCVNACDAHTAVKSLYNWLICFRGIGVGEIVWKFVMLHLYSASQEKSPPDCCWHFFVNSWKFSVEIFHIYYMLQCTLEYKCLLTYRQLWQSYAILSAITIIRSKCPPSVEMHAVWSQLMWHDFVTVGGNCWKICNVVQIRMRNRCVKFGPKITHSVVIMQANASVRYSGWWTFGTYDVNYVVSLNMA